MNADEVFEMWWNNNRDGIANNGPVVSLLHHEEALAIFRLGQSNPRMKKVEWERESDLLWRFQVIGISVVVYRANKRTSLWNWHIVGHEVLVSKGKELGLSSAQRAAEAALTRELMQCIEAT